MGGFRITYSVVDAAVKRLEEQNADMEQVIRSMNRNVDILEKWQGVSKSAFDTAQTEWNGAAQTNSQELEVRAMTLRQIARNYEMGDQSASEGF